MCRYCDDITDKSRPLRPEIDQKNNNEGREQRVQGRIYGSSGSDAHLTLDILNKEDQYDDITECFRQQELPPREYSFVIKYCPFCGRSLSAG